MHCMSPGIRKEEQIMSAGIGMEAGQQETYFAAQTASQIAEALVNLLRALGRRRTERYSDDFDKGTKLITRHVDQGGLLRQSIMEERDADTFANTLREMHIPYMQIQVRDNESGIQRIFYTRGGAGDHAKRDLPDDSSRLEAAWTLFVQRMMERVHEAKDTQRRGSERDQGTERSGKHGNSIDIG